MEKTNAIEKTVAVLEKQHTEAASTILIHALTVPDDQIRVLAARSLLYSGSGIGKTEIIRNINNLPSEIIQEITQHLDLIRFPLRECMGHGDSELMIRALETIKVARIYSEMPGILPLLHSSTEAWSEQVEHIFEGLVNNLYDEQVDTDQASLTGISNPTPAILDAISEQLAQFHLLKRPRLLIESLLILSHPGQSAARTLFRDTPPECVSIMWDILREGRHPGILHFLTDSLKQKYVHAGILAIVSERNDSEFQLHFINAVPEHPTTNQERNYERLSSIAWLKPEPELWNFVPGDCHGKLTCLVELLGIMDVEKIKYHEQALQFGALKGRIGAAKFRTRLKQERYEQYIKASLQNSDPHIESWAVSELKNTNLPDKSRLLVERLDSPDETVREQAREALERFDLQHAIEYCESATHSTGRKIAELLLKIDPYATQELARELANPIRTRRLQAAKAAHIMGLQQEVEQGLLEMLYDSDPIIRRTVVEILAESPTPQIVSALTTLKNDSNPRVRAATENALQQIQDKHSMEKV